MDGITRLRGTWFDLSSKGCPAAVLSTYHPSYILRVQNTPEGPEKVAEWQADIRAAGAKAGFVSAT